MLGLLVFYGFWLGLLTWIGIVESATPKFFAAILLLPLLPVGAFDLWLRLTWEADIITIYPQPPKPIARLLQREYGLYWFPAGVCPPLWLWATGLIGMAIFV
ncbi:MAG: hypothetical protein CVU68_00585 [Deltaproteobacteria bacterium HGW-Deltaproteobacteria-3]|nr:MAG: hypothetical protein CVU68_00585 [Deltaproteobacteria bacterium HGW-Deltaproteobacteria-3]